MSHVPHSDPHSQAVKKAAAIEAWMAPIFKGAPHLPPHARQTLVDIAPWIALIGGILGIVGVLSAGSFMSMFFSFSFLRFGFSSILFTVAMLLSLAGAILSVVAYQPLTKLRKAGWNYVFYGMLLGVVSAVLHMVAGYSNFGQIVGLLVGFWLLLLTACEENDHYYYRQRTGVNNFLS